MIVVNGARALPLDSKRPVQYRHSSFAIEALVSPFEVSTMIPTWGAAPGSAPEGEKG